MTDDENDVRASDPNADDQVGTGAGMGVSSERTTSSAGVSEPRTPEPPPEPPVHPKGAGRLHGYPKRRNHG